MKQPSRERVLDAAERLLAHGGAAFSMRELAEEARLSFATPFNQFGSKAAIMLALSGRRISLMHERLAEASLPNNAVTRVLLAVGVASSVMCKRCSEALRLQFAAAGFQHQGMSWSIWACGQPLTRRVSRSVK